MIRALDSVRAPAFQVIGLISTVWLWSTGQHALGQSWIEPLMTVVIGLGLISDLRTKAKPASTTTSHQWEAMEDAHRLRVADSLAEDARRRAANRGTTAS